MSQPDYHAVYEALRQRNQVADVDLSGLSFDEDPFESANFDNCAAAGARFVGGELASSTWKSCRFVKCQFSNMSFSGARFEDCRFFDGGSASGCTFRFCDLRGAVFDNCDLMLSTFFVCELWDVKFANSRMSGITFEKPSFAFSSTKSARSKKPARLAGTFENCKMTNATIREADLSSIS